MAKLQDINYDAPVQSLGRHDIYAPLREAAAQDQVRQASVDVGDVLAKTAIAFEEQHTQGQLTQAGLDFSFDLKDIEGQYLGRDIFTRDELETIGVDVGEEDTRINIPAYEVLPDIMRLKTREALEERSSKISNSRARAGFHAKHSAALDESDLQYQLQSRQAQLKYAYNKTILNVDEAMRRGEFAQAHLIAEEGLTDPNELRKKKYEINLTQELQIYEDALTRLDVPMMKQSLAALTVNPDEYEGFLPSDKRLTYANALRTGIAKADAANSAADKANLERLRTDVANAKKLSQDHTPLSAIQISDLLERAVNSGDYGLVEDVLQLQNFEGAVGPFRYKDFTTRALAIDALGSWEDSLSETEKVHLMNLRDAHKALTDKFLADPYGAHSSLGGETAWPLDMKGENNQKVPMSEVLKQWKELGENIHASQGIPGADVPMIPKRHERALVAKFSSGNFESKKKAIQEVAKAFGNDATAYKRFFKQLGLTKNGEVYGMVGELYSQNREDLGDTMLRGQQALSENLLDTSRVKVAETQINTRLGAMYWHDPQSLTRMLKAAVALAAGRAGDEGKFDSPETFVDEAAAAIATPVKYQGNYVAAPTGATPWEVKRWFEGLNEEDIALNGGVAGEAEVFIRGVQNGDLIPKTVDDGMYIFMNKDGTVVPNIHLENFVLDYSTRRDNQPKKMFAPADFLKGN